MSDKELVDSTIREYVNLQRIKAARDPKSEIAYQELVLKARLESFGIPTEKLDLKREGE